MNRLVQEAYYSSDIVKKTEHHHDYHQVILIVGGDVQFRVNNMKQRGRAGDVVIFSRYEKHSVEVLSKEYDRYTLHLTPTASGIESRVYWLLSSRPKNFQNVISVGDQLEEFKKLFQKIMEEHGSNDKLSAHMQQLLVNELLIMIYRKLPDTSCFEEKNANMVYEIQRRFEAHYQEQCTMEDLAKEYRVSISSLSHQFKKITGTSVMGYLLACRMMSAKSYLTGSDMSIGQVVERCGFSDSSNFSRTFKKLHGLSPTEFRERYKQKK